MVPPYRPTVWLGLALTLSLPTLISCASTPDSAEEVAPMELPSLDVPPPEPAEEPEVAAGAQDPEDGPRLMNAEDYERFESIRGERLSKDGSWLSYELRRADDTRELRLRPTSGEGEEVVIPWASSPAFSEDMKYVAWRTGVSEEEREKLSKSKEPFESECVLMNLADRSERNFPGVRAFSFDATGTRIALMGFGASEKGADLRVVDLENDTTLTLGNVGGYDWCDIAPLIAIGLKTGTAAGNGVQLYNLEDGRIRELERSTSEYRSLNWREDSGDLAVLRSVVAEEEDAAEDEDAKPAKKSDADELVDYVVLVWRDLDAGTEPPLVLDPQAAGLEEGLYIVDTAGARWSDDGDAIAIGMLREEVEIEAEEGDPDPEKLDLPGVQVWHSKDVAIYPQAKARERWDERRTLTGVWHLDENRLVRIDENRKHGARLTDDWRFAIEQDPSNYEWGEMFGRPYHDVYVTDVADGSRRLLLEKVRHGWPSAYGRYFLSFDGQHYWVDDLQEGGRRCLTEGIDTVFANQEYDTPTDLVPPYGVGGWRANDAAVFIHDRYDVWELPLGGGRARRVTNGAAERRIHRVSKLDYEEPGFADDEPVYMRVGGELTKSAGFARLAPGADTAELLLEKNARMRSLSKAEDADRFLYRVEDRETPPEIYVAGPDLNDGAQLSQTNSFLDEFHWTKAELVEWTSGAGVPLQGALLYPAGWSEGDPPAPMIVYTYEKLSQNVHAWQAPNELDYYNFTIWTQEGYFVLMPDIVYRSREPGPSAIDAVVPGVAKVVELGLADADRVGLVGHSWGGYNAAYLPTRTDIFAASVAGAPLTDFISFMGQIHWSGGIPETSHWETGQGRMEVPYWEDPEAHRRSSPLEGIPDLKTPMLMAFGDEDGAVDWDQGTQFYNYARRAGNEAFVLLVYEGEGHGLRGEANRRDYARRIREWFGHYLKDEPAPAWITEGIAPSELEAERARLAEEAD